MSRILYVFSALAFLFVCCGKSNSDSDSGIYDSWWRAKSYNSNATLYIQLGKGGRLSFQSKAASASYEILNFYPASGTWSENGKQIDFHNLLTANKKLSEKNRTGDWTGISMGTALTLLSAEWSPDKPKSFEDAFHCTLIVKYRIDDIMLGKIEKSQEYTATFTGPVTEPN